MSKFIIKSICVCLIFMSVVKSDFKGIPDERIFSLDKPIAAIKAHQNEKFIIKVAGNPSTGYGWFLGKKTEDNGLKCTNCDEYNSSNDYKVDKHPAGMVGVPGNYYFIFSGEQKGHIDLEFVNKRPWEKESFKERRLTVNIE